LPVVALGDFNSFRPAPAYRIAARGMRDCRPFAKTPQPATRPTYGLPVVIDHIFVSPSIRVLDYRVIRAPGSDHYPVLATLQLPLPGSPVA
ncbi:MAG: endonuclease/exonuclease/phosphatase family protein, partial [Phycisphaerae bacterium]